jgi:ABC-type siderophore export system fused ATPase/permease subunit
MYGVMVYFPVAALLFFLPQTQLASLEQCVKIAAITMFSTIPLIGLLSFMPMSARAAMIIWGLSNYESQLASLKDESDASQTIAESFSTITIKGGRFSYKTNGRPNGRPGTRPGGPADVFSGGLFEEGPNGQTDSVPGSLFEEGPNGQASKGSNGFTLKIDDFHLDKGELVILRGGNGSGKSTFMRVLAGLTVLEQGAITIDGVDVNELGRPNYRAYFSVIFPDFHLFNGLYGLDFTQDDVEAELRRVELEKTVSVDAEGLFSTLKLSSGQRKRLGLVCAILEKRPILLFDEVAADFDPHFRDIFYNSFLPTLKAEGRTILVISHDERYSGVADRVLTLEYGEFILLKDSPEL